MGFMKLVLKLVSLLNPLWIRAGINTVQLRAILRAKLIMDGRRQNNIFNQNKRRTSNQSLVMSLVNGFIGVFIGTMFLGDIDHEISFLLYHSI
jgi:ABC-2 type transport system permease protein